MRKELIFNNGHNDHNIGKYFQKDKKKTPLILMK